MLLFCALSAAFWSGGAWCALYDVANADSFSFPRFASGFAGLIIRLQFHDHGVRVDLVANWALALGARIVPSLVRRKRAGAGPRDLSVAHGSRNSGVRTMNWSEVSFWPKVMFVSQTRLRESCSGRYKSARFYPYRVGQQRSIFSRSGQLKINQKGRLEYERVAEVLLQTRESAENSETTHQRFSESQPLSRPRWSP